MAMSSVLSPPHSASPSILQTAARTHRPLSQWPSVCPAECPHSFVMQKVAQRFPSMRQQTTQTFLNETSQTQRQIPVKSVGRDKLFCCVPDCQEEFCKCSNEVWTAPRQDCQKFLVVSCIETALHLSFQPSCLSLLLFFLGIKRSNYVGRNKTRNKKESMGEKPLQSTGGTWAKPIAVKKCLPHAARTPKSEVGQLELYQQLIDLKICKPAGPDTSVFFVYPALTNTSHFYIALGNLLFWKPVYAITVFSVECHMCRGHCWR